MIDFRDIGALVAATRSGAASVTEVVETVLEAVQAACRPEAWLSLTPAETLRSRASELDARRSEATSLPLYGVPFAVKDNIDVAAMPTTAGCPAYAYVPESSATAVALLLDAGAVLIGKTHMDQFATGLVGTRSPHGPCRNAHAGDYVSGGSSGGSAVVVAEGLVSFALGTDTAGSGRVPAVLNGVVGLKPTRGRISTRGVVPACASLDCVSIFAASCDDARAVLDVLDRYDEEDPWSRSPSDRSRLASSASAGFRIGVPSPLPNFVPEEAAALFEKAITVLESLGGTRVAVDYAPFRATSALLYEGGFIAERDAAVGDFLRANPEAVDAAVSHLVVGGATPSGRLVFETIHELARLRRQTETIWREMDVLVVPTAHEAARIRDALARPLEFSRTCGQLNNFVNLLDLTAVAIPTAAWDSGVPFGITLCARAGHEDRLLDLGTRLAAATSKAVPKLERPDWIRLAVVGAHLEGMPLHGQLTTAGARFVAKTHTAPTYRLHALAGTTPPKPGLEFVAGGGAAIEVEVYSLRPDAFGRFVAAVSRPIAIGRLALQDGSEVSGFVCEPAALAGATDITSYGGWRAWCARK
jgi:allophanate hydrolase